MTSAGKRETHKDKCIKTPTVTFLFFLFEKWWRLGRIWFNRAVIFQITHHWCTKVFQFFVTLEMWMCGDLRSVC